MRWVFLLSGVASIFYSFFVDGALQVLVRCGGACMLLVTAYLFWRRSPGLSVQQLSLNLLIVLMVAYCSLEVFQIDSRFIDALDSEEEI